MQTDTQTDRITDRQTEPHADEDDRLTHTTPVNMSNKKIEK